MYNLYIYLRVFVRSFVCGKHQIYGTDWRQTLINYDPPGECPPRIEIARLSVLREISWHFRFFLRGRPPFLLIFLPLLTLNTYMTQNAFAKTASTVRHIATDNWSLREPSHLQWTAIANSSLCTVYIPRMLFILKHYIKDLLHAYNH